MKMLNSDHEMQLRYIIKLICMKHDLYALYERGAVPVTLSTRIRKVLDSNFSGDCPGSGSYNRSESTRPPAWEALAEVWMGKKKN
jgi:hypothetical protein